MSERDRILALVVAVHEAVGFEIECEGKPEKPQADDTCMAIAGDLWTSLRRQGFSIYRKRAAKP